MYCIYFRFKKKLLKIKYVIIVNTILKFEIEKNINNC